LLKTRYSMVKYVGMKKHNYRIYSF